MYVAEISEGWAWLKEQGRFWWLSGTRSTSRNFFKEFLFTNATATDNQEQNMNILGGGLNCLSAF